MSQTGSTEVNGVRARHGRGYRDSAGFATGRGQAGTLELRRRPVAWGINGGYQHWWRHDLRTNISGGIQHHDIPNVGNSAGGFVCSAFSAAAMAGTGTCGLNKKQITAQVNVIWNPVPFVDIALEYMWGHRMVKSNLKGDENVLISAFRVNF